MLGPLTSVCLLSRIEDSYRLPGRTRLGRVSHESGVEWNGTYRPVELVWLRRRGDRPCDGEGRISSKSSERWHQVPERTLNRLLQCLRTLECLSRPESDGSSSFLHLPSTSKGYVSFETLLRLFGRDSDRGWDSLVKGLVLPSDSSFPRPLRT